jgi:hypothetical protein
MGTWFHILDMNERTSGNMATTTLLCANTRSTTHAFPEHFPSKPPPHNGVIQQPGEAVKRRSKSAQRETMHTHTCNRRRIRLRFDLASYKAGRERGAIAWRVGCAQCHLTEGGPPKSHLGAHRSHVCMRAGHWWCAVCAVSNSATDCSHRASATHLN